MRRDVPAQLARIAALEAIRTPLTEEQHAELALLHDREYYRRRAVQRQLAAAERRHQLYLIRLAAEPTPPLAWQIHRVDCRLARLRNAAAAC